MYTFDSLLEHRLTSIDTCSLIILAQYPEAYSRFRAALTAKPTRQIFIIMPVIDELKHLSCDTRNVTADKKMMAAKALELVEDLISTNHCTVFDTPTLIKPGRPKFADACFLSMMQRFHSLVPLGIITNDNALRRSLVAINHWIPSQNVVAIRSLNHTDGSIFQA